MKVEYDLMAYQLGILMGQPSRMVIKNDLQMEGFSTSMLVYRRVEQADIGV